MTQLHRTITYLIVLAAVLSFAWLVSPTRTFTPQGAMLLSKGTAYPAISTDAVSVSRDDVRGTTVGVINVEFYAPVADQAAASIAEQYAISLAAQNGANHIVVTEFGQSQEEKAIILQARAIRS
jgi:hypothetical protein